jgi:hypothetical protein
MTESTEDQTAIRQAAAARVDYVCWIANALEQRAAAHGILLPYDADLMREAAKELRALVESA